MKQGDSVWWGTIVHRRIMFGIVKWFEGNIAVVKGNDGMTYLIPVEDLHVIEIVEL